MSTIPWDRVRQVVDAVLDLPTTARSAFLDRACPETSVRRYVESLVLSFEQANQFLDQPAAIRYAEAVNASANESWSGRRVGPYQIVNEIGRGGMGSVYLAVRVDDQYRKEVAIKVARVGFENSIALARFKAERQILADLEHPNIARLLEGGSTDDGQPYFVMEYIQGQPLDQYCDDRKLSVTERLELFRTVCSAVHYAHQKLVVHRDIKPSNILVTKDGAPKLLDFGIAKILAPDATTPGADRTLTKVRVLTPDYASPEQWRGGAITTASDVYSLGVVLYELLTGHRPYRLAQRDPEEINRIVAECDPERPSSAVLLAEDLVESAGLRTVRTPESVSATREGSPEKLRRRLSGDLDNIVLRALRKEPDRRYRSVENFAEDIRRHLENLPVSAHGDSFWYRAHKFVSRHRVGISAAAVAGLVLIVGTIVSVREAYVARSESARAERRFNDVRKLANSLIFEIHDSVSAIPGTTATRKLIVERGLEYLDSLSRESTKDTSLQAELASAYRRIGEAQGGQFAANLGDTAGALKSFQKSLEIRKQIYAADPQSLESIVALADSYHAVSEKLLSSGQTEEAYHDVQKAVALGEKALLSQPEDAALLQELASDYEGEADILGGNFNLSNLGDRDGALAARRKNMEATERLVKLRPGDNFAQRSLAAAVVRMGDQLLLSGQRQEALKKYLLAQSLFERLVVNSPTTKFQDNLHGVYQRITVVRMANGEATEAVEAARDTLALSSRLSGADPRDVWAQLSLAADYSNLADAVSRTADRQESISAVDKSLNLMSELLAHDPKNIELQGVQSAAFNTAGQVYQRAGNNTVALSFYQKALEITSKIYADDPRNEDARLRLAADYNSVASALSVQGDKSRATDAYEKAITLASARNSDSPNEESLYVIANSYAGQGNVQMKLAEKEKRPAPRLSRLQKACGFFDRSLKTWSAVREPGTLSPSGFASVLPAIVADRLKACRSMQEF
jgi:serine/threonine protein kinase